MDQQRKNARPHREIRWLRTLGPFFVAQVLIGLVLTGVGYWRLSADQQLRHERDAVKQLEDIAAVIALGLPETQSDENDKTRELAQQAAKVTGCRITIIAPSGVVQADTSVDDAEGLRAIENHKDRIELVQAAKLGRGSSVRYSSTVDERLAYGAIRTQTGVMVRAARPMPISTPLSQTIVLWMLGAVAFAFLSTAFFGWLVVHWFGEPIAELKAAAEALEREDDEARVYIDQDHILGETAVSFNRMAESLASRKDELQRARERLAAVLAGLSDGVLAIDDRQRILFANPVARRLLQLPADNLLNRPLIEFVRHHAMHDLIENSIENNFAVSSAEFEIDNPVRQLSMQASELSNGDSPGIVMVIRDVSELRHLEQIRQTFVANVSHELKTPLSVIRGYAETLAAGALHDPDVSLKFLGRIEEQADLLNRLVHDMIALSRVQSGLQTFEITDVSVPTAIAECISNQSEVAESKGISVVVESTDTKATVSADEEAFRQIMQNLIDNAVKYTPDGGSVAIHWRQEGENVVISVTDTGPGIAAEHHDRLFERFYRVDKARSRELGGTGLGLSIVKNLAHSFGGSVSVNSEVGKGSTFSVTLVASEPPQS